MSWLKKLLGRVTEDEDDYIEKPNHTAPREKKQKLEKNREIETRMTYQYPKGEFRFPIIPDGSEEKPKGRRRPKDGPKPQQENKQPIKKKEEKKVVVKDTKKIVKKKKNDPYQRPFRPTEIPSPIYGFNQRPNLKKEEDFHEPVSIELKTYEELRKQFVHEPVKVEKKPASLSFELDEEDELMVSETEHSDADKDTDEFQNESCDERKEKAAVTQINFGEEMAVAEKEVATAVEVVPESAQVEVPIEEEEDNGDSEELEVNEIPRFEIVEEKKAEPPKKKSGRSHLPFNVLMLKQDKRKLEQGQMGRGNSIEKTVPTKTSSERQGEKAIEEYKELEKTDFYQEAAGDYEFPSINYLAPPIAKEMSSEWLTNQSHLLNDTLLNFNVKARVVNVTQGPSVTRFEVQPEPGVKVNKITNLSDDIKLSLAAKDIRIEAPIPGKHTVGIEVPNQDSRPVCISEIITSEAFRDSDSPLTAALGLDISGQPIVTDLRKMPHGLIAGATGSGKSVCINSILVSLLYKADPEELKLLLIDPKMVELAPYNRIPHLVSPVITDVKAATAALKWAVEEMERRYELFAHTGVRDITRFNELAKREGNLKNKLPYVVIIIDELADLMMMSPADVEEAICRIAQKARACGIHLIIATQRPSVDVITGLIKANVPTRIAFSVSSGVDSRTIIDSSGAERLLGKGDMLFLENGSSKPVRLQGTFVSDDEIDDIVRHAREQKEPTYLFHQEELLKKAQSVEDEDELFYDACEFVIDQGGASTSSLQRRFRIGYNRAARLIEMMEDNGIVSEARGSKPRDVLITEEDLGSLLETSNNF
ncbi:S-DNA-T family DNA segregation ATPase FtsK/SpoIIIE [Bacillus pakistanensis]|uniref:S-DNA-T family DNA segregation ATPase FtsK/SpoIIIE n=1 Tax=Rossellomorea pakistanensis TaxID=992288 RepID=A0ABS2NAX8_9BACI|nr:DNA translocase FtsK [Bacillus pakistanensis]MBM7585017.1 S-DNA-T family DNA segregation ATPase FtsK/SpoIIIE [Bacillus pakistanensis]